MPDFLDELTDEIAKEDPTFSEMVEAALNHRVLMRELAAARVEADLSQTKLAAAAGTSQSQIARAESGAVDVRLSTVARMAAVLGKRVEWRLVDMIAPKPSNKQDATDQIDSEDRRWLQARLTEYRELLEYLRDH